MSEQYYSNSRIIQMDSPNQKTQNYYLLFVNTQSGDKEGKNYVTLSGMSLVFMFKNHITSNVFIYDLFKPEQTKAGTLKASQLVKNFHEVNIIICGGDGTIQWVLSLIYEAGITFDQVNFGILPIGTGNDFSRSTGWGYQTAIFNIQKLQNLRDIVKSWNQAQRGQYDIWDVEFQTYEDGSFFSIKNEVQEKIDETTLKKSFCNYVGVGLDAKVVYTVERNRGSSALLNKIRYGLVGTLNFLKQMKPLNDLLESFQVCQKKYEIQLSQRSEENVFKTQQEEKIEKVQLTHDYRGMVFLNCSSYMAGLRQVWSTEKRGTATTQSYQSQKTDDGNLQIVGFKNELRLALERIRRSGAKISQGSGPFQLTFKEPKEEEQMYIQVDGQSVKIINLRSIKIMKGTRFKTEKLKILKKLQ